MVERLSVWFAWLASDPLTKGFAAVIALTAWLFVQQDVAREAAVPVRIHWTLPNDLVPAEPLRNQVTLRVEGARAAIKRARAAPATESVDLSGLPLGEHLVDLTALDWAQVPDALRIVAVEPPAIAVELDELAEQKVQIEGRWIGEPAPAYEVRGVSVEPGVVDIAGPRTVVSRLDHVMTKPLDVSALTERTEVDAPLDLPRGVTVLGDVRPRATVDVVVATRTLQDLEVPVIVYDDYGYVPDPPRVKVSLRGPAPMLEWIGESSVVAFVRLPSGAPASVDARYGAQRGPRIEIWHPGGPEVAVTQVQPSLVRVERR